MAKITRIAIDSKLYQTLDNAMDSLFNLLQTAPTASSLETSAQEITLYFSDGTKAQYKTFVKIEKIDPDAKFNVPIPVREKRASKG